MPTDLLILGATALLALVAVVAAVIAVKTARSLVGGASPQSATPGAPARVAGIDHGPGDVPPNAVLEHTRGLVPIDTSPTTEVVRDDLPAGPAHVVRGRVVVMPSTQQVVATALSRPTTRLAVLTRGLAHALRPESRDRIRALMRREFNHRRRERARVARRAARGHVPTSGTASWIGTTPPGARHGSSGR